MPIPDATIVWRMPRFARPRDVVLHYDHHTGDARVRPIVFASSLGTNLRI